MDEFKEAATATCNVLSGTDHPYCLIGGAACSMLGSTRATVDVDILVAKGATLKARKVLRADARFQVEKGTLHTWYQAGPGAPKVEIEILAPPGLFRGAFDVDTPTMLVGQKKVLKPALLLNAKVGSLRQRSAEEKKK